MNRKTIFLAVALLGLLLSACGAAGAQTPRTITVSGSGAVRVAPDVVTVNFGVQTIGQNVAGVVTDNNRRAERLQQAVLDLGVAPEDVRTLYFSVSPQPAFDEFGNPTGVVTYWVDNTISVTLREVERLGVLLRAAIEAGATGVQGLAFSVDDTEPFEAQARQQAMDDARARAQLLAGAAGAALGDPIQISTSFYGPAYDGFLRAEPAMGIGGGGVPVEAGTTEVRVDVTVVYALR